MSTIGPERVSPSEQQMHKSTVGSQPALVAKSQSNDEHRLLLEMLLAHEAEVRRITRLQDLYLLIANEARNLTGARQIFVFRNKNVMRMTAISGLPKLDRNAALIGELEGLLVGQDMAELHEQRSFFLPSHLFPNLLWQPLLAPDGALIGGVLLASERGWDEHACALASELGASYAHGMHALLLGQRLSHRFSWFSGKRGRLIAAAAVLCLLVLAFPMRMSVLAPMEIGAQNPFIVAAPIEGVIEDVLVQPGDKVEKGAPLVKMGGVELRNKLRLAQEQVQVAEARLKKANQLAFSDAEENGRTELRMAMANLNLKQSELRYARDLFDRSEVRAERGGVVILSDRQALLGKPVVTGERIMQIADPEETELVIHVPVRDALVLEPGARVKAFLDSNPFSSREAKILYADYQALPDASNQLSFRVVAAFLDQNGKMPRLGVRGTAQIYGGRTVLGIYLFRRPLTALRQWVGL